MKINIDYLRPLKAAGMKELYGKLRYKEDLTAELYRDAVILPMKGELRHAAYGGVVDQNGNYIPSSVCDGMCRHEGAYPYDSVQERNARVVYCGAFFTHWGHFLMDATKRLWYFLKNDTTVDKYIFTTFLQDDLLIEKNEIEFLQLLGVWDKIEIINRPTRFQEVIIPEESHKYQQYYSGWHKKMFDVVIAAALEGYHERYVQMEAAKRIFFSRSHFIEAKRISNKKGESGQKILDNFFEKNGYQILYPEELSLAEMIRILQASDECAMVEGTLAHNLMFAKEGMKAVILEKRIDYNLYQVYVNEVKDLDVDYIDAYYVLYPVVSFEGPYYSDYTMQLAAYADARRMERPDPQYLSETYRREGFESFMRTYKVKWEETFDVSVLKNPVYWEVYRESLDEFKDYLLGNKYWNTRGVFYAHAYSESFGKIRQPFRQLFLDMKAVMRGRVNKDFYRRLSRCKYKVLGFLHKLRYRDT